MGKIVGLVFPKAKAEAEIVNCPHCDKTYKSQETLDKHIAEKHKDLTV